MGVDRNKANTLGRGIPQVGDLRLLEDGSECSRDLGSDAVAFETASDGWGGCVVRE